MRRIVFLFIAIMACMFLASAQADTTTVQQAVTENDIEYTDTPASTSDIQSEKKGRGIDLSDLRPETLIPILGIIFVFGLPIVIVFISFYFKYKNKKAKYRLAEQALATGQPIPEEFLKERIIETDTLQKGIKNIFLGIGLFIFLWAVTDEFNIGTIGLLIMFMGFGQVVIHYATQKKYKDENKEDNTPV